MKRQQTMRKGTGMGAVKLEQLERRQLLSAALDDSGVLRILTGARADVISIKTSGSDLQVQENGVQSTFALAQVTKIHIETGGGNDLVQAQDIALPIEALLGAGTDSLFSGSGADTVYGGSGSDLISTGDGADVIYGDAGDDRIMAGAGNDTITGGLGNDAINTGDGNDSVSDAGRNVDRARGNVYSPMTSSVEFQPGAFQANVTGYDPTQIRRAYGFGELDLTAGAGQTIYIVDAYTGLHVTEDFTAFCQQFDLPLPTADNFRIVNAGGRVPAVDSGWAMEIQLDLQWARAIAPAAKIVLVQADSNIENDVFLAVKKAANMAQKNGGGVVSMSFGRNYIYDPSLTGYDPTATANMALWDNLFRARTKVSFLAAAGDNGSVPVASYPAMSPYVTSVGGTVLQIDQDGNQVTDEQAWFDGGSGYALPDWYERPTYQDGIPYYIPDPAYVPDMLDPVPDDVRALPDVSYNAVNYAVYSTTPLGGDRGWFSVGGTSAGTPQWAALVALANQKRQAATPKLGVIGNRLNGSLYDIYNGFAGESGANQEYEDCFNDVIIGQAGPWFAVERFDMATGIGTPRAENLIDTIGNYTPLFIQQNFTFDSRLYMPLSVSSTGRFPASMGQLHAGTGTMVGGGRDVLVSFQTDPVARVGTNFSSVPVSDLYYDVEGPAGDQASAFRIQLELSGRGQRKGRIYGFGTADIQNADTSVVFGTATFTLRFNGNWWTGSDGRIHFHIEFGAVDPVTYEPLESRLTALQYNPGEAWLGGYYAGEMNG